uniref:CUB domain-containing protein n=1 Tax=Macrostomum lignano TaxID=282301 RepID=A0A1I8GSI3_9PLAT
GLSIVLNRWNGFASGAAFTLQLRPAYTNATATCNLQNACAHYVRIGVKAKISWVASNIKYFLFDLSAAKEVSGNYCISSVACTVKLSSGESLQLNRAFSNSESDPQSVSIRQLSSESAKAEVTKFVATSQPACPNVRHQQTLTWNFRNWTGKTSTGSFSVSLEPGIGVDTAYCSLVREPECDAPAEGNNDFVEIILSSEISAESSIFLSNQLMGSDDCVSRIICNFTAPNGWHRIESVVPQTVLPSTIQIDLTTESSWSEESEIYFTATSYNTCSSARHQCQLRFDNGSTQFFESVSLYTDNIEVYVT